MNKEQQKVLFNMFDEEKIRVIELLEGKLEELINLDMERLMKDYLRVAIRCTPAASMYGAKQEIMRKFLLAFLKNYIDLGAPAEYNLDIINSLHTFFSRSIESVLSPVIEEYYKQM